MIRNYTAYTRIDIRDLATLVKFMRESGIQVTSRSHAIHRALGLFSEVLGRNSLITPFENTAEAMTYLEDEGLGPERPKDIRRVMGQISKESLVYNTRAMDEIEVKARTEPRAFAEGMIDELRRVNKNLIKEVES